MLIAGVVSQNQEFKNHMANLSVPVLRIVNPHDLVPQIPGAAQRLWPAPYGTAHRARLQAGAWLRSLRLTFLADTSGLLALVGTRLALRFKYDPEVSFVGKAYTWLTTPFLRTFFRQCADHLLDGASMEEPAVLTAAATDFIPSCFDCCMC